MSRGVVRGFEPWAWAAFGLCAATFGLFVYLGLRPGGVAPVLVYRHGIIWAGWTCAVAMMLGLILCLRRRPLLQRGRVWPLLALGACMYLCALPIAYPSSHQNRYSTTRFRLPFEGTARVRFGGERPEQNQLLFDPARRFGTVFERTREGSLVALAPAGGVVLERGRGRQGEVLVIQTGEGEYCVLEGLEVGLGAPAPGSRVVSGDVLGPVPGVLSVHLQDRPRQGEGEGIPMRYFDYTADGRHAPAGIPIPPQELANPPTGPTSDPQGR